MLMSRYRAVVVLGLAVLSAQTARAAPRRGLSLLQYIQGRTDLGTAARARWEKAIRLKFGGAALDEDNAKNTQITVAKAIISAAIFMQAPPKKAVQAAFDGYHGALGIVPPPLAIHYQLLALQGRKPKGRQIDLALDFVKHYNDEIAPELVVYWERSIRDKTIPEHLIPEIERTLRGTRIKMRPLLTDKLRLIAKLTLLKTRARGAQLGALNKDIRELERELQRAFKGVALSPMVVDRTKPPFERLKRHLRDLKQPLTQEDRALDPGVVPDGPSAAERRALERRKDALREAERRRAAELREAERKAKEARRLAKQREAERKEARARAERERSRLQREAQREAERKAREARRLAQKREAERREALARAERERRARIEAERKLRSGRTRQSLRALGMVSYPAQKIAPRLRQTIRPWLGTPYRYGWARRRRGTDCSGFTKNIAQEGFSLLLPRVSRDQARLGVPVPTQSALKAGDLIFFDTTEDGRINHVGIYQGQGKFAHASSSRGVVYDRLGLGYYQRAYKGARRVIEPEEL